mmetsp:Transcript_10735/g.32864  ORF Transcript_10735/g.32864 Transcript_10735/m.32864 type:complete len:319 (-) Transcript_10735:61-1017(-)
MERCDESLPLFTERAPLHVPSLEEVQEGLARELQDVYKRTDVSVEECPDLQKWGLAFSGICGSERLLDVGGVPNLLDPAKHGISFALEDLCKCGGLPNGSVLGAAAGDANFVGKNSELMPCEDVDAKSRSTHVAKLDDGGQCVLQAYDHGRMGFLGNLFLSEGKGGKVLKISVTSRRPDKTGDFTAALRSALGRAFPGRAIGLGGAFKMISGRFKAHVMPDFKETQMEDGPEVNAWLKFFEFGPGATFLSTLLTSDPSDGKLNLRLAHTHFFNDETGQGGHYHNDTTPEDVTYEAYYSPAHYVYRIENAYDRSRCLSS